MRVRRVTHTFLNDVLYLHHKPTTALNKMTTRVSVLGVTLALASCGASVGGSNSQSPDPVLAEFPIAYIERTIPRDENGDIIPENLLTPDQFNPGAKLVFKDRAAVEAPEIVLTEGLFVTDDGEEALYDVKDLTVSADGTKLAFSMHAPLDADLDVALLPTWNIWEYDIETGDLRRVINDDFLAETGDDVDPYFLPDNRIVFSSNRRSQSRRTLLDEGKPQFAPLVEAGEVNDIEQEIFNLHVMENDGSELTQLTYNESHDLQPSVIDSGEILFTRWDNYVGGPRGRVSTYRINPDGSDLSLYYGYHLDANDVLSDESSRNDVVALTRPITLADGRLLFSQKPIESSTYGGDIVIADVENFTDDTQPTAQNEGNPGPAQESISFGDININDEGSLGGYYNSAFPLFDDTNRLIVSYSFCLVDGFRFGIYLTEARQLVNENGEFVDEEGDPLGANDTPITAEENEVAALPCTETVLETDNIALGEPAYGIWIYDPSDQTQTPVTLAQSDIMYVDAVVFENKVAPTDLPPPIADAERQELIDENVGVIHIRSVYDVDGIDVAQNDITSGIEAMADPVRTPVDERPARFLRIVKAVSIPSQNVREFDNSAFGEGTRQMKDIIGYVPIEPDGSVKFRAPASVALSLSIVDANGRRIDDDAVEPDEPDDVDLGQLHGNWLSVTAGETKECVSCHTSSSTLPHGRTEAQRESANPGASSTGFANTLLVDNFGTQVSAQPEMGQSMAEYYSDVFGPRTPTTGLEFTDEWTADPSLTGENIFIRHSALGTPTPEGPGCLPVWTNTCRVIINYETHIQPIWELTRSVQDINGIEQDRTCINCHAEDAFPIDAGGELLTQLDLTAVVDPALDYIRSYSQLFEPVLILELDENGILSPRSAERVSLDDDLNILYQTDADGNFILDAAGDRIPITSNAVCSVNDNNGILFIVRDDAGEIQYQTNGAGDFLVDDTGFRIPRVEVIECTEGRRLRTNGARNNNGFFSLFTPGSNVPTPHWDTNAAGDISTWLSDAELKLLSEWLDIGAQYYNNPFDAPVDN